MPAPSPTAVSRPWLRLLAMAVLAVAIGMPGSAFAKKKKKKNDDGIWQVGFESIDTFFDDVSKLDRDLSAANRLLDRAKGDLNSALGLKKRTTLPKALAELDKRADGKVALVMKGKVPTLKATDAVPTDVNAGIDAVNGFTKRMTASMGRLAEAPKTAQSLTRKSRAMPNNLKAELSDGNIIAHLITGPKAVKAVNHNVGITKALPGKANKTVTRLDRINRSVIGEFGDGSSGKAPSKGKGK